MIIIPKKIAGLVLYYYYTMMLVSSSFCEVLSNLLHKTILQSGNHAVLNFKLSDSDSLVTC